MYVAWRDLRFARGRFVLIGTVVTLITLLVGFLSGLTGGLADQNISAITGLGADRIVFSAPVADSERSFADSAVTEADAIRWRDQAGVRDVHPLGISQQRVSAGDNQVAVALFGSASGFGSGSAPASGHLTLPRTAAAKLGIGAGDSVTILGSTFVVDRVTDDTWYSHTPVSWLALTDWQKLAATTGSPGAYATVLAVTASGTDWSAADTATGTSSAGVLQSLTALSAFRSEIGSLLLMVAMLFGISALVVGAFFTVWSMQRQPDVAVLKALGASNRMLVGDALGQAALVLIVGVGLGIALTALLGALAGTALPFVISPLTTLLPGAAMIALGLAGAAFALRSVTTADPLTALGSNR
ncbi:MULTISPECIES: FtsX-like permease family protein [unclassified Cryobacterium]|uniref:FtsX-like permease family protein n=1 Tax=unclassified Cryobacterium TaxID=2649013 RepID=UPI00106A74FA|nr:MULTISPECIES: ABC transporter permease [unclassified Cryobacterium]MDY7527285.1 ABC transporter permease [Cryobacterium sp. 10C2]MDY7556928.1 ABC transporter permease [Cryobacterium sp. 10C3]MEB0003383.1 ABC transporter permease [Cryobacterium sp. RTC2.1]MEB0201357.1 ABC transporter permease [Cryobacterium sp. 5I3]MEB0285845.1 ABC transporter permease [Cryobacterium sp. 10S3]